MIVEKILGNLSDSYPVNDRKIDTVALEWYELDKKLLRKETSEGETIGIRISGHMHEGDVLWEDDSHLIVIDVVPTDLTVVAVDTMQAMGRLCFELGNRHLSLSIGEHEVRVPYDAPTFEYLEKLGFAPVRKKAKFAHFTVCHAHGHSHAHETDHNHGHSHTHEKDHNHGHSHPHEADHSHAHEHDHMHVHDHVTENAHQEETHHE